MKTSFVRSRTVLVTPLVLLTVALIQDIVTYQFRLHVRSVALRVAITMVLNGAAFAAAAEWVSPWIKRILSHARTTSRRGIGELGPWLFYAVAYGALYFAFWIVEVRGPGALLVRFVR
jgi:hypothetical protein